ncbi:MAG: hypothetical protein ABSE08_15360 [Syntrophobacteraceae bacterium]|jgi:hypothetical protein
MASVEKRISDLEASDALLPSSVTGFVDALREGRLRAAGGEPFAETPITREMMDDPVHGEFYRLIHEARERVRNSGEATRRQPVASERRDRCGLARVMRSERPALFRP